MGLALLSAPAAAAGPAGMNGSGTAEDPYEITNVTQLQAMEDEPGANYTLVENVDASGVAFEPIGNESTQFTGSLDGQGHVIDGLGVDVGSPGDAGEAGLFGNTSAASIENVSLEDADVFEHSGDGVAGVLIGTATDTNVSNVYVDGGVNGQVESVVDDSDVGGLIGTHNGSGTVSTSLATVGLSGTNTGGLVGSGDGDVESSYWDESVSNTRDSAGGGENSTTANLTGANTTDTLDGFDFDDTWIATDDYPTLQGSVDEYTLELQADELGGGETTDATIHLLRTTATDLTATDPADFETDANVSVTDGVVTAERDGTGTVTASASGHEDTDTVEVDYTADFQLGGVTDSITVEPGENVTIEATIENVGGIEAEQGIDFEIGDEVDETRNVELGIDESTTETFEWETTEDDRGDHEANVSSENDSATTAVAVERPATFEVDTLDVPDEVVAGETLEITATIENVGDNSGETDVALTDVTQLDNETVALDGGENETVTLEYAVDEDAANGTIDATVSTADDSDEETVDVQAVDIFEIDATTDSITAEPGDIVSIEAAIENVGGADGEQELSLRDGDDTIETQNVTLDSGGNDTVTFEWETDDDDRGDHTATIESEDDSATTDVAIEQPATFDVAELDVSDDVNAGETLEVEATIENVGDRTGNGSASLLIDGNMTPVDNESTGDIDGGESETVSLEYEVDEDADTGDITANVTTPDDSDEQTVSVNGYHTVPGELRNGVTGEPIPNETVTIVENGDERTIETNGSGEVELELLSGSVVEGSANTTMDGRNLSGSASLVFDESLVDEIPLNLWPELDGEGTDDEPYNVTDVHELQSIRQNLSATYELQNDVDASDAAEWQPGPYTEGFLPVGSEGDGFEGTLDGDGHALEGLEIDGGNDLGLFDTIGPDGIVVNLSVTDASIDGDAYLGVLASANEGAIGNVTATGEIRASSGTVGGLVGTNRQDASIDDSAATVEIDGEGNRTGGLIGQNSGFVRTSYAAGSVEGGEDHVGGLIGTTLTNSDVTDGYWDTEATDQDDSAGDATGLMTDEMTGFVAESTMDGFDFGDTWHATPEYSALEPHELDGVGTDSNPYEIENAVELQLMAEDLDANYTLVEDIDASATTEWNDGDGLDPVGDEDDPFEGSLDGDGHEIENLTASATDGEYRDAGLFGSTVNASLSDVHLVGANVVSTDTYFPGHAGALVGSQDGGTIAGATVADSTVTSDQSNAGGLVGTTTGNLTGVEATGVVATDGETLGGAVGNLGEGSTVSDVTLDDLDLDVGDGGAVDTVGLLSASGDGDDVSIEDVTISTDLDLDAEDVTAVGGLVGDGESDGWTVEDVDAAGDLNVNATDVEQIGLVAGIAGGDWTVRNVDTTGDLNATAETGTVDGAGLVAGNALDGWDLTDVDVAGDIDANATGDLSHAALVAGDPGDDWNLMDVAVTGNLDADAEGAITESSLVAGGSPSEWSLDDVSVAGDIDANAGGVLASTGLVAAEPDVVWELTDVEVTGDVDADADGAINNVALVAGDPASNWIVENVSVAGDIDADADGEIWGVGLVAGDPSSGWEVDDVGVTGDIAANASADIWDVGGFAGTASSDWIVNETAVGSDLTVTADETVENVGGFTGSIDSGSDYALDNVSVRGDHAIEAGSDGNGSIANVGGLVGLAGDLRSIGDDTDAITNAAVRGGLEFETPGDASNVGGLVGQIERGNLTIDTAYAAMDLSDDAEGGIVGNVTDAANVSASDVYWDADIGIDDATDAGNLSGARALNTSEMTGTNASVDGNMDGFDFEDTWTHADGYPLLTWQIEAVALSLDSAEIEPAESTRATVVLALADGSTVTATETADYASDDASVATAANGTVTAVDDGSTTIAAAVAGQNSSTSIVVASPSGGGAGDGGLPGDGDSSVSVVDLAVESATPTVGETVTATVTVENDGAFTETYDGALTLEGESIAEESVSVDGGETASYTVTHAFDEPGEYTLSAGGESVTVTVGEESDGGGSDDGGADDGTDDTGDGTGGTAGDETDDGSDSDGSPGFGAMVALVSIALVAATGLARRS